MSLSPFQEPITSSLKRLTRLFRRADIVRTAGMLLNKKVIKLLKNPITILASFISLYILSLSSDSEFLSSLFGSSEDLKLRLEAIKNSNANFLTDFATILLSVVIGLVFGIAAIYYGKKEERESYRALYNGMDLFFHQKTAYIESLAESLWTHVYYEESKIVSSIPSSSEAFKAKVIPSLEGFNQPQRIQSAQVGACLRLYERWLMKSPFTMADTHAPVIEYCKECIRIKGFVAPLEIDLVPSFLEKINYSFWHSLTTSKAKYLLWKKCSELNKKYNTDLSPEEIIWVHKGNDQLLKDQVGAPAFDEINEYRKMFAQELFSEDEQEARKHIALMFYKDVANSFRLRLQYDPEYCANELSDSPYEDNQRYHDDFNQEPISSKELVKITEQAKQDFVDISSVLQQVKPSILNKPEVLRAFRAAYHVNKGGIRKILLGAKNDDTLKTKLEDFLVDLIDDRRSLDVKNHHIQFVRGLHTLTSKIVPYYYFDIYRKLIHSGD